MMAFMPALNGICDDFIQLLQIKRDEDDVVQNFQDVANLMGFEGNATATSSVNLMTIWARV